MKIIKRGKDPKEVKWLGECSNCKTIMEAARSELVDITWDQREGGEFGRANCAVCGRDTVFYPKEGK